MLMEENDYMVANKEIEDKIDRYAVIAKAAPWIGLFVPVTIVSLVCPDRSVQSMTAIVGSLIGLAISYIVRVQAKLYLKKELTLENSIRRVINDEAEVLFTIICTQYYFENGLKELKKPNVVLIDWEMFCKQYAEKKLSDHANAIYNEIMLSPGAMMEIVKLCLRRRKNDYYSYEMTEEYKNISPYY